MEYEKALAYLEHGVMPKEGGQIINEIDYFFQIHCPEPKLYLAYDRSAYIGNENPDLRITIDQK